jgi:predicted phosphodiesterase
MTKITVYSDLHLYSPIALWGSMPADNQQILEQNAYSLGDIFDRKSCEPVRAAYLEHDYQVYIKAYEGRWVNGNHELAGEDTSHDFIKVGNILLTHGDRVCWHDVKSNAFRNSKKYEGYGIVKRAINWFRKYWTQSINNFEVEQATKYCKLYDCDVIIYGHSHTKKLLIKKVNGITIYNVPRGKTVLDV